MNIKENKIKNNRFPIDQVNDLVKKIKRRTKLRDDSKKINYKLQRKNDIWADGWLN